MKEIIISQYNKYRNHGDIISMSKPYFKITTMLKWNLNSTAL